MNTNDSNDLMNLGQIQFSLEQAEEIATEHNKLTGSDSESDATPDISALRNDPSISDEHVVLTQAILEGFSGIDGKFRVLKLWLDEWEKKFQIENGGVDNFVHCDPCETLKDGEHVCVFIANNQNNSPASQAVLKLPRVATSFGHWGDIPLETQVSELRTLEQFRHELLTSDKPLPKAFVKAFQRVGPERYDIDSILSHLRIRPIYFAMEKVVGQTLREKFTVGQSDGRQPKIPIATALRWMIDVAAACKSLHQIGTNLVHRDLKPDNIILDIHGDVRILDLGIASNRSIYSPSLGNGTPPYMSPHQIAGEPARASDDVWAWGVMFYELLTGSRPYEGETVSEVSDSHQKRFEGIGILVDGVPDVVAETIESCIDPNSESNSSGFTTILEDLRPVLNQLDAPCGIRNSLIAATEKQVEAQLSGLLGNIETLELSFRVSRAVSSAYQSQWSPEQELGDIDACFKKSNGVLLILGEPGAGKTVSLLRLAKALVNAKQTVTQQPPVYISLPSLFREYQRQNQTSRSSDLFFRMLGKQRAEEIPMPTIDQFLEYIVKFIRNTHAHVLISENELIETSPVLCFDGLDEVPQDFKSCCVEHLNHIVCELGLSVAVTCRSEDYKELLQTETALNKSLAVEILPLTSSQIERCLQNGGQSIVRSFEFNPDVRELASTPLGLSILFMAYSGVTGKLEVSNVRGKLMVRHVVVEKFIDRMQQRAERRLNNTVCDNDPEKDIPENQFVMLNTKAKSLLTWLAKYGSEEFQIHSLAKRIGGNNEYRLPFEISFAVLVIAFLQYLPFNAARIFLQTEANTETWIEVIGSCAMSFAIAAAFLKMDTHNKSMGLPLVLLILSFPVGLLGFVAQLLSIDQSHILFWVSFCATIMTGFFLTYFHFWSSRSKLATARFRRRSKLVLRNRTEAIAGVAILITIFFVPTGVLITASRILIPSPHWISMMTTTLLFFLVAFTISLDLSELAAIFFILLASSFWWISSNIAEIAVFTYQPITMALVLYLQAHCVNNLGLPITTTFAFAASAVSILLGYSSLIGICSVLVLLIGVLQNGASRNWPLFKAIVKSMKGISHEAAVSFADRLVRGPVISTCVGIRLGCWKLGLRNAIQYCQTVLLIRSVSPSKTNRSFAFAHNVLFEHFQLREGFLKLRSQDIESQKKAVTFFADQKSSLSDAALCEISEGDFSIETRTACALNSSKFHSNLARLFFLRSNKDKCPSIRRATVYTFDKYQDEYRDQFSKEYEEDDAIQVQLSRAYISTDEEERSILRSISAKIELFYDSERELFRSPETLSRCIDSIVEATNDELPGVRLMGVRAIHKSARIPDCLVVPLIDGLRDENEMVVAEAILAISKHGGEDVVSELKRFLYPWKREHLRIAAVIGLCKIDSSQARNLVKSWYWSFGRRVRKEICSVQPTE
jgi:serine/threonine protein kinase